MYVNGEWRESASVNPIYEKFSGKQYAEYPVPGEEEVNEAFSADKKTFEEVKLKPLTVITF